MAQPLPPFYLIVDDAAWLEQLVPAGLRLTQLRLKTRPEADIRAHVRRAQAVCAAHGATLVVNDAWRIAIDEGCAWVHLGQDDLATADLAAIRAHGLKLGISTHDDTEIARALAVEPDYLAFGPIFHTGTKTVDFTPHGTQGLAQVKARLAGIPLVAIGGITLDRAPDIYGAGADSIAVIGDVLRQTEPEARLRAWLAAASRAGATEAP